MWRAKRARVAAEAGTVKFWTTSARAGCMLYLYGESGTTYQYIHLNNDLTREERQPRQVRGRGRVRPGKNGAHVEAGQPIGYVGDSGDANGIARTCTSRCIPAAAGVSPLSYLKKAYKLLFTAKTGTAFALTLEGPSCSATPRRVLDVKVATPQAWPSNSRDEAQPAGRAQRARRRARSAASADRRLAGRRERSPRPDGQQVVMWTQPAPATLEGAAGRRGALAAALVVLAVAA